ncbi:MAG: response regulator [Zetaproteobacteria bacterium]|nr:response regulator [Zetaproteobacteria bacterium]
MSDAPAYDHLTVLVVDDNNYARKLAMFALQNIGFKSIILKEGVDEAVAYLRELQPPQQVDLIVSDWNMPGKTGLELFKMISDNQDIPQIPFLMLTGVNGVESIQDAFELGIKYYVIKPFTEIKLKEKIDLIFASA